MEQRIWRQAGRARQDRPGRPSRIRRLLMAATLLVVGSLAAIAVAGHLRGGRGGTPASAPAASAPPWRAGVAPCRRNPMAHVHDPSRLVVLANCSTVSGTVKRVR